MVIDMDPRQPASGLVRLGLRANWPQFALLVATVADHTHPSWRAQGLGVYRFWRDLGYAIGAVIAGLIAQALGLNAAVIAGGALTLASGLLAARWLTDGPRSGDPSTAGAHPKGQ
jgi:predicted MFS family arabinose efflux permease